MFRLPITTAPKDGTFVLLWGPTGCTRPNTTPWRCQIGRYIDGCWLTADTYSFTIGGREDATHWTPLEAIRTVDDEKTGRFALSLIGIGTADAGP